MSDMCKKQPYASVCMCVMYVCIFVFVSVNISMCLLMFVYVYIFESVCVYVCKQGRSQGVIGGKRPPKELRLIWYFRPNQ